MYWQRACCSLAAHACLPHATKMSLNTSMSCSKKSGKKILQNRRMRFVDWHDALAVRCLSQRCSCCTNALISTLTLSIVVSSPWERIASRSTSTVQSTKSTRLGLLYRPWALPVSNGCPEKTPRHNPSWNCASSLWPCVPPATQQEKKHHVWHLSFLWFAAIPVMRRCLPSTSTQTYITKKNTP